MNPERQQAVCYLRAPHHGLWRWADQGTVLVWGDGSTIAFREELLPILEWLRPHGLPSFGALVLLLAALRGKVPVPSEVFPLSDHPLPPGLGEKAQILLRARRQLVLQLEAALEVLRGLQQLPSELQSGLRAKCVLAEAIFERARAERHEDAASILEGWREVIPATELNDAAGKEAEGSGNLLRQIHLVAEGLRAHSPESLALRLRTGLDALPREVDVELPPAERARRLIEELSRDPEHGAVARAARELMAAVRLPRHLGEREELAVGGVSDLTNRGPLDRLLLSELAHDDLTLAVRVALNEALFLRREPPAREPPGTLALLLDSGVRLWGMPRVLAGAVALALAAGDRRQAQVCAWRAHGREVRPVDLLSRNGLLEHLSALEVEAQPGAALAAFAAVLPPDAHTQTVLITHPDVLHDPEFRRALAQAAPAAGFLATVDRSGRFELHALPLTRRQPLCQADLDLKRLFADEKIGVSLLDPARRTDLPAIFSVSPFPLLLPFAGVVDWWSTDQDGQAYVATADRRLIALGGERLGGRLLACGLPAGKTVWMGASHSSVHLLKAGSIRRPVRLVSVPVSGGAPRVFDVLAGSELLAAHATGGVLFLIRTHKVRAFSLVDGRPLGGTVHPHRWVQGRFFASHDRFYCATWDGQTVQLEPVTLPLAYSPENIEFIFDRNDAEGPWLLHRDGSILSSVTGERLHLTLPVGFRIDATGVSADGHRLAVSCGDPPFSSVVDLRTGLCEVRPFGLLPLLDPFGRLPGWNVHRLIDAISGSLAAGISLCGRKGRWQDIQFDAEPPRLRLCPAPAGERVRHCLVFSPHPAPPQIGCTLQAASWLCGTQVFLDSRGLLHLKSHDPAVPEVSLVLSEGEIAGWTADGHVCGRKFFIGDRKSEPEAVYRRVREILRRL